MTTALKMEKVLRGESRDFFAYGFDAAGFSTHPDPMFLLNAGQIEFIDLLNPTSFEMADGVIIPQGFEQIEHEPSIFGAKTRVTVHKAFHVRNADELPLKSRPFSDEFSHRLVSSAWKTGFQELSEHHFHLSRWYATHGSIFVHEEEPH